MHWLLALSRASWSWSHPCSVLYVVMLGLLHFLFVILSVLPHNHNLTETWSKHEESEWEQVKNVMEIEEFPDAFWGKSLDSVVLFLRLICTQLMSRPIKVALDGVQDEFQKCFLTPPLSEVTFFWILVFSSWMQLGLLLVIMESKRKASLKELGNKHHCFYHLTVYFCLEQWPLSASQCVFLPWW